MIPQNIIDRLNELPIEQVAEEVGLTVSHHKSLCPFHPDSRPSLTFNCAKNRYKCYVCESYGGPIDLALKQLGLSFTDACRWLGNRFGIYFDEEQRSPRWSSIKAVPIRAARKEVKTYPVDKEYLASLMRNPMLNQEAQRFLFEERRLNRAVVSWCGISSCSVPTPCWRNGRPFYDAPSLLIPYKDADGRIMSVQGRYLGDDKHSQIPRFRFPRNSECHVFNLPILKLLKPGEPLFISEGVTDCLALLSAGHKAIAIPSATLLKREDIDLISRPLRESWRGSLHIYPDNDEPGERLYQQLLSVANELGCCLVRHELPSGCKDFAQYWAMSNRH